jgi:hypothetical protein
MPPEGGAEAGQDHFRFVSGLPSCRSAKPGLRLRDSRPVSPPSLRDPLLAPRNSETHSQGPPAPRPAQSSLAPRNSKPPQATPIPGLLPSPPCPSSETPPCPTPLFPNPGSEIPFQSPPVVRSSLSHQASSPSSQIPTQPATSSSSKTPLPAQRPQPGPLLFGSETSSLAPSSGLRGPQSLLRALRCPPSLSSSSANTATAPCPLSPLH